MKPLGIDDDIVATFAVIDAPKHKLSVAPQALTFDGDADTGWTLTIDGDSPVFPFLRKYRSRTVHMALSYKEG